MEKNNKKLIVFMPSMEGGGVEKNIILISNFLSKHIKGIRLITFDKKFNNKFNSDIKIINPKKVKKKKYSKYYKYFFCLIILVKEILKNRESLIFSFQANIYCIILSIVLNVPIIIRSNTSPTGWTKNILKHYLFKVFFKVPNNIIVNSHDFKKEIDKKFNIKSKVIYNPLNKIEILKKSSENINFNFFKSKKILKIINVARFTNQKDHITLLKAFRQISNKIDARLLIVGYGVNELTIKNFIKKNGLTNKIKIKNYQKNPYKFISKSDVFVLSSLYEGLPNVMLEAMLLKKFIISSNCPTGPSEILQKGKYGFLFKVGDYNELSKKIITYSKNKKLYKHKIINGYKSLVRFDFDLNCLKYLKIILKIT